MLQCGLLVYAGQAETRVALKKTEDTMVWTAAGEAPSTECPYTTPSHKAPPTNPQTRMPFPLLPHKVTVEQVDSLGQQRPFPSAVTAIPAHLN